VFAGLLLALSVLLLSPAWAAAAPGLGDDAAVAPNANGQLPAGWKNTQWGPFGPADQALLENVRRANLWEGEGAAVMGMQKGSTQRIKDVGKALNQQHKLLEAKLVEVAGKLQTTLPTQPNSDQQGWLGEMRAATGPAFDQVWVDRLRAAHGKIFSLIASVRANTRNSLVRDFAAQGNSVVSVHMALLESTGLVKFNELPTPVVPTTAAAASHSVFAQGDGSTVPGFVWLVLGLGVLGAAAAVIQLVRTR
jgi:predicted outer membrane protein